MAEILDLFKNTNKDARFVPRLGLSDRYEAVRKAIRSHRDKENRPPVAMPGSPEFLHSSGEKRRIMIWGPRRRSLRDGDPCPECGYEFDSDEWEVRHLHHGPALGQTWLYTCPSCDMETCKIGT